nr:stage II sporulation protein M [uncultured Sellimonas sp.]
MTIEKEKQWLATAFMAGFIGGILFANLFARDYVTTSGIFNPYFLNQYAQADVPAKEYAVYLAGVRSVPLILIVLLGQTKIRKVLVSVSLAWFGFSGGMIACGAILNMGMAGVIFWLVGMIPQFVFYALAYLIVLWYFFTYPKARWNPAKTIFVIFFLTAGLVTEAYVNPILMQLFLKTI